MYQIMRNAYLTCRHPGISDRRPVANWTPVGKVWQGFGQGMRRLWARSDFRAQTMPVQCAIQRSGGPIWRARSVGQKQTLPENAADFARTHDDQLNHPHEGAYKLILDPTGRHPPRTHCG
jgi:hypothetical protein